MANNHSIKIHTPATEVEIDDSKNLITTQPGKGVSLEFKNTEGLTDEEVNNIQWIANMFHGRPQNSYFHQTLKKGPKASFKIPEVYSGGGLGWVEPVIPGHAPQYKPPFGYFINSIGKRNIDKVEWCNIHGKPISGSKFFSEAIQLHIYTTGLYGHEIKVWLKDTKYFDYNLDLDEDLNSPDNPLAQYFSREVKVMQNPDGTTRKVQKVVIDVRLETRWQFAGNVLNIMPIIEYNIDGKKRTSFKDNAITVEKPTKEEKGKINNATKSGNKPVIVGDIVTDVAEFKPCFYTSIKAEVMRGEEKIQDVTIYEQGRTPNEDILTSGYAIR